MVSLLTKNALSQEKIVISIETSDHSNIVIEEKWYSCETENRYDHFDCISVDAAKHASNGRDIFFLLASL